MEFPAARQLCAHLAADLGRGCATALAEAGCRVVINGLDQDRFATTAKEIRAATGAEIIPISGDISTEECQHENTQRLPETGYSDKQ